MSDLPVELNRIAGTTGLDAPAAASKWAYLTENRDLVDALNRKAGTTQLDREAVIAKLAGLSTPGDELTMLASIDPTVLKGTVPGVTGSWFSAPDSATLNISGVFRAVVRVALTDWTPVANQTFVSHYVAGGNVAFLFYVGNTGSLGFIASADGTTATVSKASVATGFTDGTTHWVGIEYNTGTGAYGFFTAADNSSYDPPTIWSGWTAGSSGTATATTFFDSATLYGVGGTGGGGGSAAAGTFYRAQLYDDGVLVYDFDPRRAYKGARSVSSATGETYTVNGTAAIA